MNKDEALEQARYLLQSTLHVGERGKTPFEARTQGTHKKLSDLIGDFLREQQNGYDDD